MSGVHFHEVSKTFALAERQVVALQDISVDVKEHEFVSIVGPSGCGKSTLLLLAAGLVAPTTGRIMVEGRPVTAPVTDVGIVFQRDVLFDWRTVVGNVMLPADIRRLPRRLALEKTHALLHKVGLTGFEHAYPWQLSGGMRQRVAICRALLHDTSLLLMDEPFGALDALTRDQMVLDLLRIWSEDRRTAVFITHDIAEAIFLSDRVLVMSPRPGHIVADVSIDLPRPRELDIRDEPRFNEYQRHIRKLFESLKVIG
jgi:NitT/TauT family transport system ATP-binding protein